MQPDFVSIRWRFLIVAFVALFFCIGAVRHGIKVYKRHHFNHATSNPSQVTVSLFPAEAINNHVNINRISS